MSTWYKADTHRPISVQGTCSYTISMIIVRITALQYHVTGWSLTVLKQSLKTLKLCINCDTIAVVILLSFTGTEGGAC